MIKNEYVKSEPNLHYFFKINDAKEEKKDQGLKEVIKTIISNGAAEGTSSAFQGESSASSSSHSVSNANSFYFRMYLSF